MNLAKKRIILTGATGGLGITVAKKLSEKGASLALVGRDTSKLEALKASIETTNNEVITIQCDLNEYGASNHVFKCAKKGLGDVDVLVNNAGVLDFIAFENQTEERIAEIINTNVTSLIKLTRTILPTFQQNNSGYILCVGSIFGSLGFPHFATYCASKFAVHGFSQALRRELVNTNIGVGYVAPRAIETAMNNDNIVAMNKKTGNKMDSPEYVANIIICALEQEKQEVFIGQPQSFFAWLNAVAPRVVNMGLRKQTSAARPYLK